MWLLLNRMAHPRQWRGATHANSEKWASSPPQMYTRDELFPFDRG
jgi:hypothetical protein